MYIGIVGWLFVAYVIALIANKSNQAFLIRQNSGTLMWIAATCAVPLAELIFTSKLIFGEKAASFSGIPFSNKMKNRFVLTILLLIWLLTNTFFTFQLGFIVGGLVTVLIGLILYRSTKERIRSTLWKTLLFFLLENNSVTVLVDMLCENERPD